MADSGPRDWRQVFAELAADGRLSRAERKALRAVVADEVTSDARRDTLRALAFDVARERLNERDAGAVLEWIEDVSTVLTPRTEAAAEDAVPPSEAWFSPGEGPLRCIRKHIQATRRALAVCVYTITDDRIVDALLAAVGRGIEVRVVGDDMKTGDPGNDLVRLAREGADVRVDRSPDHMHHKFALFDTRTLLTGSYNWTRSAERGNAENVLVTSDPVIVEAYAGEFERVWGQAGVLGR